MTRVRLNKFLSSVLKVCTLYNKLLVVVISVIFSEIRDYAVKIGINPDTEKHLLNIALDGLMSPLPDGWKPW